MSEKPDPFRTIFENVLDGILLTDLESNIVEANPAFCSMLGYERDEIVGRNVSELLHPDFADTLAEFERTMEAEGRAWLESCDVRKDGTPVPIEVNGSYIHFGGERCFLGVIRDIRRRRELEREARLLLEREAEIERHRALGTLAGGMAHELNNVLSVILLEASGDAETLAEGSVQAIRDAAERGRDVVQRVLTFASRGPAVTHPVPVNPCLRAVREILLDPTRPEISVGLDLDERVRAIEGSISLFEQLMINLGTNARDAIEGEGEITFRSRLEETEPERTVSVEVEDDGPGIAADLLDRIAEPFFTTKKVGDGTGLGLSVVRGTVERWGGSFSLESTPGVGTLVRLRFPSVEDPAPEEDAERPGEPASSRYRVAVIDDDEMVRRVLVRTLLAAGHEVGEAASGGEGLELLGAEPFDVLVVDYAMPDMSGIDFLTEVRARGVETPAVLSSGLVPDDEGTRAEQLGVRCVLRKPFRGEELKEAVERARSM